MRRHVLSLLCVVGGVMMMVFGLSIGPSPGVVAAQPMAEPSPRPPFEPPGEGGRKPTPVIATGRVTGTIIDLTTGAPIPGVQVDVGGVTVVSDANGNYERTGLPSGFYTVTLQLDPNRGTVATPAQNVAVGLGDTVVVHLFFYSQVPTASAVPPVATIVPTTAPTAPPRPTATVPAVGGIIEPAPGNLPVTSVESAPAKPARLPVTATGAMGSPSLWLIMGAVFVALGAVIQLLPRGRRLVVQRGARNRPQRPADHTALLSSLLAQDLAQPRAPAKDDAKVLETLLSEEVN